MVDIQSKEVIDKISEDLKVQPSLQIPRELAKQIQLQYNINPDRLIFARDGTASDATSVTIHTTSSVKDTFLVGAYLGTAKSALSDSTNSSITITPFGRGAIGIIRTRYEPLTAASNINGSLTFPFPIKLERGSNVVVTNSTATASIDTSGIVFLYEVDLL